MGTGCDELSHVDSYTIGRPELRKPVASGPPSFKIGKKTSVLTVNIIGIKRILWDFDLDKHSTIQVK